MIPVPKTKSPTTTELETKDSRLELLDRGKARKVKELRVLKSEGQRVVDPDALMQMMLDGKDIPAPEDVDTQLTAEILKWQAIGDARQSLKAPLAKAKYEDATTVLAGLKKPHDEVLNPLLTALAEVVAPAWVELFQLSRDLKDKDIGWRNGVCDLVPKLVELFGPPTPHGPLASFLQEAVRAGYLKAQDLPSQYRA
jgi:hypothetical protein